MGRKHRWDCNKAAAEVPPPRTHLMTKVGLYLNLDIWLDFVTSSVKDT